MRTIILNGADFSSMAEVHSHLAAALAFPDWYGANLDALYDCLSEVAQETTLVLRNREKLEGAVGTLPLLKLYRVFIRAAEENPNFSFYVEDEI